MAILEELPEVEVTIDVNGQPLKEYPDPDAEDDEDTITRYVEAVSEQEFAISFCVKKWPNIHESALILRKTDVAAGKNTVTRTGMPLKDGYEGKFHFTALETASDSRAFHGEIRRFKNLGNIILELRRARFTCTSRSRELYDAASNTEVGFVSEKAIKGRALSHTIKYIKHRAEPEIGPRNIFVAADKRPLARYIFKYHSIDDLKSMLIIPRTPTPPPLEERDVNSLSAEEIMELQRRFKAYQEADLARVKVKREATDENPRPRKISRPDSKSVQVVLNEAGDFEEVTNANLQQPAREVIELD